MLQCGMSQLGIAAPSRILKMQAFDTSSIRDMYNESSTAKQSHIFPAVATNGEGSRVKRHAACDECRTRKLKCSGEEFGCSRCIKQKIQCRYSVQKQMGRPRKRQRTEEDVDIRQPSPSRETSHPIALESYQPPPSEYPPFSQEIQIEPPIDPSLAAIDQDRTNFSNICSGPIAQTIRNTNGPGIFEQQVTHFNSNMSNTDALHDSASSQAQYPLNILSWPDFSTLDSLPVPMQAQEPTSSSYLSPPYTVSADGTYYDADADPAALQALPLSPACPCLPNLYLTLSTLSTLSAFPVTSHTIETLLAAHKTAQSVVYCHICPQKYQTGAQNLMLGCTLLNILADHWRRILGSSADDLKKGFGSNILLEANDGAGSFISVKEGQAWRNFAIDLIQAYIFGKKPIPHPPSRNKNPTQRDASSEITDSHVIETDQTVPRAHTLVFLIDALGRRQRQWHKLDAPTDEFPDCSKAFFRQPSSADDQVQNDHHHHHQHQHQHQHHQRSIESRQNGTTNEQVNSNGDDEEHRRQDAGDHVLCLMLVKHAMDMVRTLDVENT